MTSDRRIYVHIQLPGTLETVPAALLKVRLRDNGTYVGRFGYGDRYLERANAIAIDPFNLPLGTDEYETDTLKGIPGAVRDASPDAWGRRVIQSKLGRTAADLEEVDYLIHGPRDGAGNLSFGLQPTPPVESPIFNRAHQLSDLVQAAEAIEDGRPVPTHLEQVLEPGTSLGGARPKTTVEDEDRLWLAKFPEKADRCNFQRIEYATLELARACGLNVCRARLETLPGKDVLMLERFDRQHTAGGYLRSGLVSGLTLLNCDEHYLARDKWSYPLLADALRRWSDNPKDDCAELFRRMLFNAAVTNNDDHPRNHAALRDEKGWRLSPAYDLVPMPVVSLERRDLALTAGKFGRAASVYNLLSQCDQFGLSSEAARAEIEVIANGVRGWREHFRKCGVVSKDIEYVASAFLPECFFFEKPPTY